MSYVGDVFGYEVRGRAMGIVRSAVSLALIVGVPLATMVTEMLTVRVAFLLIAAFTLVALILSVVALPKGHQAVTLAAPSRAFSFTWRPYMTVLKQKDAAVSLLALFLWSMVPTGMFIYLAAWLQDAFGFTDAQVGWAFSLIGIGSLVGNALAAISADRLGKKRVALIGLVLLAIFAIALPWSVVEWLALVSLFAFTAGLDFSSSAFFTLLSELSLQLRATLLSLTTLTIGVATGLTPLLLRPLWEMGGYPLVAAVLGAAGLSVAAMLGLFVAERPASTPDSRLNTG